MRKPAFCLCENKDADQLCGNHTANQRLCFQYIVQSLYCLNPKFQVSIHLLWLYSPVCVGPGRKPRRRGSYDCYIYQVEKYEKDPLVHHGRLKARLGLYPYYKVLILIMSQFKSNFPHPLIQEEQVVSYLQKNEHLVLVNCLQPIITSAVYHGRQALSQTKQKIIAFIACTHQPSFLNIYTCQSLPFNELLANKDI